MWLFCFFFQAEDGIRDLVRSRGLGDVYKRQVSRRAGKAPSPVWMDLAGLRWQLQFLVHGILPGLPWELTCLHFSNGWGWCFSQACREFLPRSCRWHLFL